MTVSKFRSYLRPFAALLFCVAVVPQANAAVLVADDFSYADGDIVGEDPPVGGAWGVHSGSGGTDVLVTSGTISLVHGAGSREDVNVPLEGGPIANTGVLYTGFDLTVPNPGAAITDVLFAHTLVGTTTFSARMHVVTPLATGYRIAISNEANFTDNDGEVRSVDLAFGETYRLVTKYDATAKRVTLWVDPANETDPSITATDPGFSDAVAAWAFRQGAGNTTQVIDNLLVATTFDEVSNAIPEPASACLALLASLAIVGMRGRRVR